MAMTARAVRTSFPWVWFDSVFQGESTLLGALPLDSRPG